METLSPNVHASKKWDHLIQDGLHHESDSLMQLEGLVYFKSLEQ